jgi:hypothetical protein
MSEHRTTVVARWPHVPLGTRVEIEVPESYECESVAYQVNLVAEELWKGTPNCRVVTAVVKAIKALFRK